MNRGRPARLVSQTLLVPHHQQPAFSFPVSLVNTDGRTEDVLPFHNANYVGQVVQAFWSTGSLALFLLVFQHHHPMIIIRSTSSPFTHSKPGTRGKHSVPHLSGQSPLLAESRVTPGRFKTTLIPLPLCLRYSL